MPTFRAQTGGRSGITNLIAQLVGGGDKLTAEDEIKIGQAAAATNRSTALAEKARAEMQAAHDAELLRRDPDARRAHAARAANLPNARYADDIEEHFQHGAPLPAHITPEMVRAYNAQRAGVGAVDFATAPTNAQQMAAGASTTLADMVRGVVAGTRDVVGQNQLKASLPGSGYREPYGNVTNEGLVTNQETGAVSTGNAPLLAETIKRITAQAGQAGAAAGLSNARRNEITDPNSPRNKNLTEGRPAKPRTPAQERRDNAYAARAEAAAAAASRAEMDAVRSEVSRKARRDPAMKDRRLGNWDEKEGAFEVLDKSGKIIGYYD